MEITDKVAGKKREIPYIDASACYDDESSTVRVFLINRDLQNTQSLRLDVSDKKVRGINRAITFGGMDLYAKNTFEAPDAVVPEVLDPRGLDLARIALRPLSLTYLELDVEAE